MCVFCVYLLTKEMKNLNINFIFRRGGDREQRVEDNRVREYFSEIEKR